MTSTRTNRFITLPTGVFLARTWSSCEAGGRPPPHRPRPRRKSPRRKIPPRFPPPRRSRTSPKSPHPYSKARYFSPDNLWIIFTWARLPWLISAEMLIVLNYNKGFPFDFQFWGWILLTTPIAVQVFHHSQGKGKNSFPGGRLATEASNRPPALYRCPLPP